MHIDTIDLENYTQLPRQNITFPDCHLHYLSLQCNLLELYILFVLDQIENYPYFMNRPNRKPSNIFLI